MRSKFLCMLVHIFLLIKIADAQIIFEKTFRFSGDNSASDVRQTRDSGFVLTGTADLVTGAHSKIFLIKTNTSGDTLWTRLFGDTTSLTGNSVIETFDGSYIIAGTKTFSPSGYSDAYLVKTDSAGVLLWSREIDISDYDFAYGIVQTTDGGFVFTGSESATFSGSLAHLVKTDASGNVLWSKTYGNTSSVNYGYSLQQTADGGFILGGTGSGISTDYTMIKTDSLGNLQWQKSIGDVDYDENYSIAKTLDGGYILAGTNYNPVALDYEVNVVRTDAAGNMIWSINYGDNGAGTDQGAYAIIATTDGSFVFGGYSSTIGTNTNSWLTKIGATGNVIWSRSTPSTGYDAFYSLRETQDGGFVAAGSKNRNFGTSGDIYFIRTDSNGITACNQSVAPLLSLPFSQENSYTDSATSLGTSTNPLTSSANGCTIADVCTGDPTRPVWPGDCNYDLLVNNTDFLSIGFAYGDTGAMRSGASLNWVAQPAIPWQNSFSSGINHKHADCNGDGVVDSNDVAAIYANYYDTHPLRMKQQNHPTASGDFYLVPDHSIIGPGDTVNFAIHLGNPFVSVDSVYGLAFSISFDETLTDTNHINLSYTPSVLGTLNGNMKSFEKDFYSSGAIDAAVTRIDHTNAVHVQGVLGNLMFVASNDVTAITTLYVNPNSVQALTHGQVPETFNVTGSSVVIDPGLGIHNIPDDNFISLFPNPADDHIVIRCKNSLIQRFNIFDASGRNIYSSEQSDNEINLPMTNIEAGTYLLNVITGERTIYKMFNVIH